MPKAKRTQSTAQAVEHLLSKHKTLSSNPNTAKNIKIYIKVTVSSISLKAIVYSQTGQKIQAKH
jgi:hypothetical protein